MPAYPSDFGFNKLPQSNKLILRQWHPTPVLLPGKSHGWRSLVGCSPWGCKESDTTERLHFTSCTCMCFPHSSVGEESACNAGDPGLIPGLGRSPGEGKGYPLQYSGLENFMECVVHGVTKSRTRLSDFTSLKCNDSRLPKRRGHTDTQAPQ